MMIAITLLYFTLRAIESVPTIHTCHIRACNLAATIRPLNNQTTKQPSPIIMSATPQITSAVSHDNLEIPLIDFSVFLSPNTTPEAKLITAQAILDGFKHAGFIYLRNHGIPKSLVQETFTQSAGFFARPQSQKDALAWTTPEANRGYVAQGREKVTDETDAHEIELLRAAEGEDIKESLEIGREGEKGHPNRWPEQDGEAFKAKMLEFFNKCKDLHVQVMRAIAVGLGIQQTWFDEYCDVGDNTLRLLHYPEVKASVFKENERKVRAGAHTDYG